MSWYNYNQKCGYCGGQMGTQGRVCTACGKHRPSSCKSCGTALDSNGNCNNVYCMSNKATGGYSAGQVYIKAHIGVIRCSNCGRALDARGNCQNIQCAYSASYSPPPVCSACGDPLDPNGCCMRCLLTAQIRSASQARRQSTQGTTIGNKKTSKRDCVQAKIVLDGIGHDLTIIEVYEEFDPVSNKTVYVIRVESPFVLTAVDVKSRLGIGFKVLSCDSGAVAPVETPKQLNTDNMAEAIIREGYRALAKVCHPDIKGNAEAMVMLNKTKADLAKLLAELKNI